jgi:hypothetical protein
MEVAERLGNRFSVQAGVLNVIADRLAVRARETTRRS